MFTFFISTVSAFKSQDSTHTCNGVLFTGYRWRSCTGDVIVSCMGNVVSSMSDVIIHACIFITIIYGLLSRWRDSIGFIVITIIDYL